MADQLPTITGNRAVNASVTPSTTLLGRGLAAILNQKKEIAIDDQDKRYRQARDIYNRITDYGSEIRFNDLIPKQNKLLEEQQLLQLQPFFTLMQKLAEVFTVFQELADHGFGKAYFPLANMYRGGQGISANIEKTDYYIRLAFDWCFANKALDDPEIWTDLGLIYEYGRCVEQDDEMAVFLYRKAAKQGYANAQNFLGFMWENGYCEEGEDYYEAAFWYRKAAEQGHPDAQTNLGFMWENGYGVEQDHDEAVFWYHKAAEQGYAKAQFKLGEIYGMGESEELAVFWYRKAAEQGYAEAQSDLANMYDYGMGIKQDGEQATFWYFMAAEQGDAFAQLKIGYGYDQRLDIENTVFWYRKAAEQDGEWAAVAQENLRKLGINWKDK